MAFPTIESAKGPISCPCMCVQLAPMEKMRANNYNPNNVPSTAMDLLEISIDRNGLCFAIVTVYDPDDDTYVIVDGFHRYTILKDRKQAQQCPIVVLAHNITQRMEATVQFNRARGVHQVELMGDLVKELVQQGVEDTDIAVALGMELEEVYRLKQVTGIAALFANQSYSKSWIVEDMDDAI